MPTDASGLLQFTADAREPRRAWRRLWRRLRAADRRFTPLFTRQAALSVESLDALVALLGEPHDAIGRVRLIEAIEKRADRVVDEVRALLRRAWWPPFSGALVIGLINALDDVIDVVEDAAESLHLYHVTAIPHEAKRLADFALESAVLLQSAIEMLGKLADPRGILALCGQVDDLEAQADHVQRAALSRLFREERDALQVIKLKAIYEVLEELTDRCKDVAKQIALIVLRHG